MITLNIHSSDFGRAVNRARVFHNRVARLGERAYKVQSGKTASEYTVRFFLVDGEKKAACSCRAGQEDMLCHHVASALTVHVALMRQRQPVAA
ncbi:MAG TPA: hypothetical protein VFD58_00895 [Blastocatellia bacterium]|nr:hypothetical protein [Blastocatellia bacterium]